jgi:hypothetical protein
VFQLIATKKNSGVLATNLCGKTTSFDMSELFIDLAVIPESLQAHTQDRRAIYEAARSKNLRVAQRRLEEHSLPDRGKSIVYRREVLGG